MEARTELAANYRYWQEHGGTWADEYDRRKKSLVLYHIEELMLADYIGHSGPARVLEFGCGVGRHLRYLRELPGVEAYGYDQSPTMVGEISRWATPDWIAEHVKLGPPVGTLPFEDKSFDIVYTAEVLVHVRPEDLGGILNELLRIAKWQLYHLETAPDYQLASNEHDGCWHHDLVRAYRDLGHECEMLARGYRAHVPHRVVLEPLRSVYTPPAAIVSLLQRAEDDLQGPIRLGEELTARVAALEASLRETQAQAASLLGALQAEQGQVTTLGKTLEAEQARSQSLLQEQRAMNERLVSLSTELSAHREMVWTLQADLRAQHSRIGGLSDKLGQAQARTASLVDALEKEQSLWHQFSTRLADLLDR